VSALASASVPGLGTTAVVLTTDEDALPAATDELRLELERVDAACSRFRSDSELSRLNHAAGTAIAVSPLLAEAVDAALRAAAVTGGLVDPTVGASLRLLGYDRTFTLVRSRDSATLQARAVPTPGWHTVELDRQRGIVRLPPGVELDLGATAKALAADRAAHAAAARSGCGVLVSLGGDIAVAGQPPEGGWPVLIADDHRARLDGPGPVVAIAVGGLATSSTFVRRWRAGSVELHHIVDPRTGRPAQGAWRTVSVAAACCVDANTASTAAIVLGGSAPAWLEARGLSARLVEPDGNVVTVGGWPGEASS
jgi:thiamine biosynthesis lipoprotein